MDTTTGNERRPTVNRRNGGSIDGMVECAVSVLMTSEDGDSRASQWHEPADSGMVERDHAAHENTITALPTISILHKDTVAT